MSAISSMVSSRNAPVTASVYTTSAMGRSRARSSPGSPASELADPLERERRLDERSHGQAQQEERVVVPGCPVQVELVAASAPMHDHPLAGAADRDGDRLHQGTAVRVTV